MTPAEKLSKTKQRPKPPRNEKSPARIYSLICHCREKRKSLKLTIEDVATATRITAKNLWDIEHGANLMMTTALKLCEFYGCLLHELWSAKT